MRKLTAIILSLLLALQFTACSSQSPVKEEKRQIDPDYVADKVIPTAVPISGSCGENVTYELSADGTLTISGTGWMTEKYDVEDGIADTPWFEQRAAIKKAVVEEGVTSLGYFAFYKCKNMKEVVLPEGLTEIKGAAFQACVSLEKVEIPQSCTEIGRHAFADCRSLKSVEMPPTLEFIAQETFYNCLSLESIIIPEGVKNIWSDAFTWCEALKEINIPSSVEKIWDYVFSGCKSLESINVAKDNQYYTDVDGVLFDKSMETLLLCPAGKADKYTIPDGVTYIAEEAFFICANLKEVTIPESVEHIGVRAFYSCSSLKKVYILPLTIAISDAAFMDCEKVVIYGKKGSTAEEYAKTNNMKFKEL